MFWKILVQIAWMALRGVLLASMVIYPAAAQPSAVSTVLTVPVPAAVAPVEQAPAVAAAAPAPVTAPVTADVAAPPAPEAAAATLATAATNTPSSGEKPVVSSGAAGIIIHSAPPAPQTAALLVLYISPSALPTAAQGAFYEQAITISGGMPPYNVTGTLSRDVGLSFTGSGGSFKVSGTPNAPGDVILLVTASDSSSPAQTASQQYTIDVKPASDPPVISATVVGEYGKEDWYRSSVTVYWYIAEDKPLTPPDPCPPQTISGEGLHTASCTATSADGSTTLAFPVNIDLTRPEVSGATPQRAPDKNGFYTAPISFAITGTDSLSGIDFCPDATYSGPDSASGEAFAYCYDKAGNPSLPFTISPIPYDTSGPIITISLGAGPDFNGWYNRPVAVNSTFNDLGSGVDMASCISVVTQGTGTPVEMPYSARYDGPDTQQATIVVKCTDNLGNWGTSNSIELKYDATAPAGVTGAPNRSPDQGDWYNHPVDIVFTGTDAVSGIASCTSTTYSGPEGTGITVPGSCTDKAGNTSAIVASAAFNYKSTAPVGVTGAPVRPPDHGDWYNHPVVIQFSANPGSGFTSCTAINYSGPDGANITVKGSCTDAAGNTSAEVASTPFNYDATAPVEVSGAPLRSPDKNGWYNHPVEIVFGGTDATSGIDTCTSTLYSGPDGAGITVQGNCTDKAGNTSTEVASAAFNYDATAPTGLAGIPARPADHAGWFNHPVEIHFSATDTASGIDTCTSTLYSGPDGAGITVSGSCTDKAGNSAGPVDFTLNYDATAPVDVAGAPVRPPDHNGWYNSPVKIQFSGKDATSGIESCTLVEYNGPDGTGVSTTGSCTDKAGNTSPTVNSAAFDYDATAPVDIAGAPVRLPDHNGWYNHPVDVQFTGTDATSGIAVCSLVHYDGPDGIGVTVSGFCEDVAGNTSAPVSSSAFNYDNTNPVVTVVLDVNGPIYLHQPVQFTWTATDATSGVDWERSFCGQPDTSQVGPQSLLCQVWDIAGNGPATASLDFSVLYRFDGFFRPVTEGWNEENAGRTLPIKFHLADYYGAGVDGAVVSMTVTPVSCPADGLPPYAGSTNIEVDLLRQQRGDYHFHWKTDKDATGCAQVAIDLQEGPGNEHLINIMWK